MRNLSDSLKAISESMEIVPDEAQCPVCRYFDVGHPDFRRIALARDPRGLVLNNLACKCATLDAQRRRDDGLRRMQANLPHQDGPRTFENFRRRDGAENGLQAAQEFADLRSANLGGADLRGPTVLVLVGQTGTGKSHLLEAIGRQMLNMTGWTVRYDTAAGFLDRLRSTIGADADEDMQDLMAWYQQRKLLLLDDIGFEKASDFAVERLTRLVDERLRNRWWLAVATNLDCDEMARRLGDRLASRLFQTNAELREVRRVTLTCDDYRGGA